MQLKLAIKDFWDGLKQYRIWWFFAWMEVKQRYRRSLIGPWWISLSMLIFVVVMGVVYSRLFKMDIATYVPFFTAGFLFWSYISACVTESTQVLKDSRQFIKQINLPFSVYIFKHLARQAIFLAHNIIIYILVLIYFKIPFTANMLLVFPGFIILTLNMFWISLFISIISVRFRDMIPIVASCMQIAFFITPITWMPKLLNPHSYIIKLNPFTYFIEIVRSPLLGITPMFRFFWGSSLLIVIGFVISFILFAYSRNKIAFWVD